VPGRLRWAIGLGLNTAIVLAAATLTDGIMVAFRVTPSSP
jgi:hypothetical protein